MTFKYHKLNSVKSAMHTLINDVINDHADRNIDKDRRSFIIDSISDVIYELSDTYTRINNNDYEFVKSLIINKLGEEWIEYIVLEENTGGIVAYDFDCSFSNEDWIDFVDKLCDYAAYVENSISIAYDYCNEIKEEYNRILKDMDKTLRIDKISVSASSCRIANTDYSFSINITMDELKIININELYNDYMQLKSKYNILNTKLNFMLGFPFKIRF